MTQPIRLWIIDTELDLIGGAERVLYQIVMGLDLSRFAVTLVMLYGEGEIVRLARQRGIHTVCHLGKNRFDPRIPLRLFRLARQERPDLVFTTGNLIATFWGTVLRQFGYAQRQIVAFHTARLLSWRVRPILRWRKQWVDRFVALAPAQMHFWQQQLGLHAQHFTIIPNGIDTTHFTPPADKRAVRRQLGLPEDALIIGNIAFFKPVKNLSLFVEIAAEVKQQFAESHFVLVGDGVERPHIEEQIRQRGLTAAFTLPGLQRDTAVWHQAMDILLLTSHSEAFPLTLAEAAACGVPVVATAAGGVPDVVQDGKTGLLAPPGDKSLLVTHLARLCHDPALRQQLGQNAREWAVKEFSVEQMVQRYSRLFLELLEPAAKPLAP